MKKWSTVKALIASIAIFVLGAVAGYQIRPLKPSSNIETVTKTSSDTESIISRHDLHTATNEKRVQAGLAKLKRSAKLDKSAQLKCKDMVKQNYWSHSDPEGRRAWYLFEQVGYLYSKAGENLAQGYATGYDTVSGWMTSPTHKRNMLDTAFQEVGYGVCVSQDYVGEGRQQIVVQHLGTSR